MPKLEAMSLNWGKHTGLSYFMSIKWVKVHSPVSGQNWGRDLARLFSGQVPIWKFKWPSPMTLRPPTPTSQKKPHITICTDARGMALRHSVVIESRNAVKTCFRLHILWKDLGTNKFLAISGWVPGTPCWNLSGSQEPVEPVLVRSLFYITKNSLEKTHFTS